jgi:hypothetical protein
MFATGGSSGYNPGRVRGVSETTRLEHFRFVAVLALAVLLSAFVGSASALEPGVHADPGTPAGKEYAIPLGQARSLGGASGSFGHGITSAATGSPATPPANASRAGAPAAGRGSPAAGVAPARASSGPAPPARVTGSPSTPAGQVRAGGSGASAVAWGAGFALAVILAGALGGQLIVRQMRRHHVDEA